MHAFASNINVSNLRSLPATTMSFTNGYAATNGVANGHGPTNPNHLLLFRPEIMAAITDETMRSLLKYLGTLPEHEDEAEASMKSEKIVACPTVIMPTIKPES